MKISFAHNVQNRHKTLRETIEMEREYFPDSSIYVAFNDPDFNLKYFDDLNNITYTYYVGNGHKIGCVNGCIVSIKQTLCDDSEIIVFSHDDVKLNPAYLEVFNKNLENIYKNKFDIICRKPHSYGNNYYMMEGFYLRKNVADKIFRGKKHFINDSELPQDLRKSPSPEVWLHDIFVESKSKISSIEYYHSNNNYNITLAENLGFLHKNAGVRGWKD